MTEQQLPLTNQIALVTGASSGIGRAIAITLAAQGADLIIHGNTNQAGLEQTADAIRDTNRQVTLLLADLSDAAAQSALVIDAWAVHHRVNIWVNNAGRDVLTGDAASQSFDEKLTALWELDVRGTIGICRRLSEPMTELGKSENSVILNMGWDQAEIGQRADSGQLFAPVKAAVMAYSRSLARELAPHVRVNCLAPGWIRTAWGEEAAAHWDERARSESLMQRWGTPADVALAATHVAAPAASFITGQTIYVNGGLNHEHIRPADSNG